ncbi:MAG: ArsR family transcriptional regulator [Lachnospiraceae bacterium]|nr:ArsR family transcriptional regulator [Lachnospiraceae bacterium]
MKNISDLTQAVPLFKCLGSDIRIAVLELLSANGPMAMKDIAEELEITAGSLSPHIKMLADNNLISIKFETGKHGLQRICTIIEDKLIIDFEASLNNKNIYETSIAIGLYSDYSAYPTCGLSTAEHLIGIVDDPKFFSDPERINAGIIWFTVGHIEYMVPNYLEEDQLPVELLISFEISSEAPGIKEDWPSDILFYINNVPVCTWISPGDFGKNPGIYTPDWWDPNWNQYGLLKFLSISDNGTFIDGVKVSDVSLSAVNIVPGTPIKFKMEVAEDSIYKGGLTLFGHSFGNYNQDIKVRMQYKQSNI